MSKEHTDKFIDLAAVTATLQKTFNDNTNGEIWLTGLTKEDKVIDWPLCSIMELAEALESTFYKHWKDIDKTIDKDNIEVELTDVWHFVMSDLIRKCGGNMKMVAVELVKIFTRLETFNLKVAENDEELKVMFTRHSKELMYIILSYDLGKEHDLSDVIIKFLTILKMFKTFDFEEMYKLYIGKNALNVVRQMNGYKTGEYVKMWKGAEDNRVEDNVIMLEVVKSTNPSDLNFDDLVVLLDREYQDRK